MGQYSHANCTIRFKDFKVYKAIDSTKIYKLITHMRTIYINSVRIYVKYDCSEIEETEKVPYKSEKAVPPLHRAVTGIHCVLEINFMS